MKNLEKKPGLHFLNHFLVGVLLTFSGYDIFIKHQILASFILLFGITFLGYSIWTFFETKRNLLFPIIFHLFEALVLLFTAYIFFVSGKKYLQYVIILASIGYFIAAIVFYRRYLKTKHNSTN
jgi:hypothetical protein